MFPLNFNNIERAHCRKVDYFDTVNWHLAALKTERPTFHVMKQTYK